MSLSKQVSLSLSFAALLGTASCHKEEGNKASLPPKGAPAAQPAGDAEAAAKTEAAGKSEAPAAAPKAEDSAGKVGQPAAKDKPAPAGPQQQQAAAEYRLTGQIAAVRHAQLGFRVAGYIKTVNVRAGNAAKAGETPRRSRRPRLHHPL